MHLKHIVILSALCFSQFLKQTEAQGTGLLERYYKQYFKDYYPSTVRSYTLYGKGQNGAVDFQGGLPYPYEKSGPVHPLVFTAITYPPPTHGPNPYKASKRLTTAEDVSWEYPDPNPLSKSPQAAGQQPSQPSFQQQQWGPDKDVILGPEPIAESRMVEDGPEIPMSNVNFNGDGHAEISMQSTMSF